MGRMNAPFVGFLSRFRTCFLVVPFQFKRLHRSINSEFGLQTETDRLPGFPPFMVRIRTAGLRVDRIVEFPNKRDETALLRRGKS